MNNKNRTEDRKLRDKIRYVALQKTGLTGKTYSLTNPLAGKNKAQRNKVISGFQSVNNGIKFTKSIVKLAGF
jgi:hypothetical protein